MSDITEYIIGTYADPYYDSVPFHLFDFKTMLKKDVAVNKETSLNTDGSPNIANYYINSILVAKKYHVYIRNTDNVLTQKREELVYILMNGSESDVITIKKKEFNLSNPSILDGAIAMNERVVARELLIQSMKSFVGGLLMMKLLMNLEQVVAHIQPFWDEYKNDRQDFIELGTQEWKQSILSIDLNTTTHVWLNEFIAPSVTVKDYMVNILDY